MAAPPGDGAADKASCYQRVVLEGRGRIFHVLHLPIFQWFPLLMQCYHYHFQKSDLDVRIRCANCSKSSYSKAWSCNCGHLWHICGIHVPALKHGENARNAKPRTRDQRQIIQTASTCKRRLHNNALFEEILDDDLKREAKKARF